MPVWNEGYVDGIDYQHGFYREMAPAQIAFALLLKGYRPPAPGPEGFDYAELGAGYADTSTLLAALHPDARFDAMDFNPSHVADARRFARQAGLDNLRLLEESFADFAARGDRDYDVVALHGIWSWVSAANRAILVDILRRRLRPGGVAFVSYNALPGKAGQMAVQKLLFEHCATGSGDMPGRIGRAIDFAARISDLGLSHLGQAGGLAEEVARLKQSNRNYVAHEYLNRDWTAFYSGDVARELAGAKLSSAGPALIADELANLALPREAKTLVEEADPAFRETLQDILINRRFRRDLFVKGAERLSARERRECLGAMRFALLVPASELPAAIVLPGNQLQLQRALAEPLIAALDAGPRRLDELAAMPALAEFGQDAILQGLTLMAGTHHLAPALSEADEAACAESARRFNAVALERNRMGMPVQNLASPVLGGGVSITKLEGLFLLARSQGVDPATFAGEQLSAQGQALVGEDGVALTQEQTIATLREQNQGFGDTRLPMLRKHGVA